MGDKRTKEVFALYLKRITAHAGRAFAPCMDGLDDGSSAPRILMPSIRLLRALQRCMSGSGLFPARLDAYAGRAFRVTGLQAQPHGIPHAWHTVFGWIGVSVHHPVFTDVGL
jgi:hypothetical protein